MGLTNNAPFTFKSGATATGSYLKVSGPAFMVQDSESSTGFTAATTLETYYSKEARDQGKAPMQIEDLKLPVDPAGVYAVLFGGLKQKFPESTDVLDEDPDTTPAAATPPATTDPTPAADTTAAVDPSPAPTSDSAPAPAADTTATPAAS